MPKRSVKDSAIIAPGGGTKEDVSNLARDLNMDQESVMAVLHSQGSGVRVSRSAVAAAVAAAPSSQSTTAMSSAWADFMNEEGVTNNNTNNNKRVKPSPSKPSPSQAVEPLDTDKTRHYHLPITPRMRLQGSKAKSKQDEDDSTGLLAQTGTLDATVVGRKKPTGTSDLVHDFIEPTLLGYSSIFSKIHIALIAASSSACHSLVLDIHGNAYSWGRNEAGQCGTTTAPNPCVPIPTRISWDKEKLVGAAVGKSHSLVVSADGHAYAVGYNKFGQCGINSSIESVVGWKKCVLSKDLEENSSKTTSDERSSSVRVVQVACGEHFTVLLTDQGHLYSCGLSEFGQLGNGETGEYFITANKLAFANCTKFERRSLFVQSPTDAGLPFSSMSEESKSKMVPLVDSATIAIASIACGRNHTIAVEASGPDTTSSPRVFSWGSGAYGCLGHGTQTDEFRPRLVASIRGPLFASNGPVRAAAGTTCSMVLTTRGHVYYWGKHRSVGEATMRPTIIDALANNGHVVTAVSAGSATVFCSTSSGQTVSWGQGPHGELGYGTQGGKSSAKPQFVEKLDKCFVTDIACGYGHTLFLIRDKDADDRKAWGKLKTCEISDLTSFINYCEAGDSQLKKK